MASALRLASLGWHVFPLRRSGKRPLPNFTRWEERATSDSDQIYRWWRDGVYNIGVATGRSGLVVVDCDTAKGDAPPPDWAGAQNGVDVLKQLAGRAGERLPQTFTVRTPSEGLHLYFESPPLGSMANTAGKLGWRIDTRGAGGYVVGPGSTLAGRYYRVIRNVAVAPLPAWIIEGLTDAHRAPRLVAAPPRSTNYVRALIACQASRVAGARVGARNNTLNAAAFILGRLVEDQLAEVDAWAVLLDAASRHVGVSGFTVAEMERTIRSGLTAGMQCPQRA